MLAALIAVGAFLSIPIPFSPAPLVLQNLFVILAGLLLPPVWAFLSVAAYLVLGAIGLPIFSGASGGLAHFAGPTGGYLLGFAVAAPLASLVAGERRVLWRTVTAVASAIVVTYAFGVPWLARVASLPARAALVAGMVPFLLGDIAKGIVAVLLVRAFPEETWRTLRSTA